MKATIEEIEIPQQNVVRHPSATDSQGLSGNAIIISLHAESVETYSSL